MIDRGKKEATILFDLDGTLIDSTEAILESFSQAFGEFGYSHPKEEVIKELIGYPLDIMFSRLGVDSELVSKHVRAYKEHYRKISCLKTKLLPSAKDAVFEASKFAKLGVVTTKTGLYSKELLKHLGLLDRFDVLVGREDVANPKPHPEPILKTLKLMNRSKERCWMVGDTVMDIEAAKAAGIGHFAVTCGYGEKSRLSLVCDNIASDAISAVEAIRRML